MSRAAMNSCVVRSRMRRVVALLALLAVGGVLAAPLDSSADDATLATVLDPPLRGKDQETYRVLQKYFARGDRQGAWNPTHGRTLLYLAPGEALLRALQHNLTIRMNRLDAEKVRQAVAEAEAVFDPVFNVAVNRSETFTYARQRTGPVRLKKFEPQPDDKPYLNVQTSPFIDQPQVDRIGYLQSDPNPDEVTKTYDMHLAKDPGSYTDWSGSLSVTQKLPWGQQLSISKVTTHKEAYYDAKRSKSWDAPWALSITANIFSPVPYGKNHGPSSPQNVDLEQAKRRSEKVDWVLQATVDAIIQQTSLAYWDVVQRVENLLVAIKNQRHLAAQAGHARRMLAAGKITQYGRTQIDTELAHAKVRVVAEEEALVSAASLLSSLIEGDAQAVGTSLILPVAYHPPLQARTSVDWKQALATAWARRPELKVKGLDLHVSQWELRRQENQARPDLSFSLSATQKQDNSIHGYESYGQSLSHAFQEDSGALNVGVRYNRPWKNRSAKAALARAHFALDKSRLSEQWQKQTVRKEVSDALTALSSTAARIKSAATRERLAAAALSKGRERWQEKGDIGEMELVIKSRTLLDARLAQVAARVAYKKAETQLLAAQGIVAEEMAKRLALNDFDRHRLLLLASTGATHYFSAPEQAASAQQAAAQH